MSTSESTCWTVIRGAAAGDSSDRAGTGPPLPRRRPGVPGGTRWQGSTLLVDIDDAGQEVFPRGVLLRQGGVLDAAIAGRVPSFRAFFYGVIRNVARRFESRPTCAAALPADFAANEESQSRLFERTWARSVMVEAARLQRQRAHERGDEAVRRVELLRLRFEDNLPIRTIAERWGVPAAGLHHAYALARQEFKAALLEVVAFHQPGSAREVEQEAAGLLKALS